MNKMTYSRPLFATFARNLTRTPRYSVRPMTLSARFNEAENPHAQRAAQEDREKINPEPNEYSKSMTDSDAAQQQEAAYNANISNPQDAKDKAGEGKSMNPLDTSPANPDISQHTSEIAGTPGKKPSEGSSGGRQGKDAHVSST